MSLESELKALPEGTCLEIELFNFEGMNNPHAYKRTGYFFMIKYNELFLWNKFGCDGRLSSQNRYTLSDITECTIFDTKKKIWSVHSD